MIFADLRLNAIRLNYAQIIAIYNSVVKQILIIYVLFKIFIN